MATVNTTIEDLTIQGMSCRHCVDAVQGALARLEDVTVEEVSIGRARVSYPTRKITTDDLRAAVEDAGFTLQSSSTV